MEAMLCMQCLGSSPRSVQFSHSPAPLPLALLDNFWAPLGVALDQISNPNQAMRRSELLAVFTHCIQEELEGESILGDLCHQRTEPNSVSSSFPSWQHAGGWSHSLSRSQSSYKSGEEPQITCLLLPHS